MGRPRLIASPDEMLERGYAYFDQCKANESPILITALALALGLSGREAFAEYGRRPEFSDAVKELKSVCESYAESRIYSNNAAGAIFALKNYGWTDQLNLHHGGEVAIKRVVADL